jgi:hypothetical protein
VSDESDGQDDVLNGEVVDEADLFGSDYEEDASNPVFLNLVEFAYGGAMLADRPNGIIVQTFIDLDSGQETHLSADPVKSKRLEAHYASEKLRGTGVSQSLTRVKLPTAEMWREKLLPNLRAEARRTSRPRLNSTTSTATKRRTSRPPR